MNQTHTALRPATRLVDGYYSHNLSAEVSTIRIETPASSRRVRHRLLHRAGVAPSIVLRSLGRSKDPAVRQRVHDRIDPWFNVGDLLGS